MVKLIGVIHGADYTDITMSRYVMNVLPSNVLLNYLLEQDDISKIAIEHLSEDDTNEVTKHMAKLSGVRNGGYLPPDYWYQLINRLKGHKEIVFLEDKDIWLKYNHAVMEAHRTDDEYLIHEKHESDRDYHEKLVNHNERHHKKSIKTRKIHEIDRDDLILKKIKSSGVDTAICGLGHTDYWMSNVQEIQDNYGIEFDKYSAERLMVYPYAGCYTTAQDFELDSIPDPENAYEHESLLRMIRLIETGQLTNRKPHYVGTWNMTHPSEGYFEMFIEKKDGSDVYGTILDKSGDALFEGKIDEEHFSFVKRYCENNSISSVAKENIQYNGFRINPGNDNDIIGKYFCGYSGPFYMKETDRADPIELSMAHFDNWDKERIESISFN